MGYFLLTNLETFKTISNNIKTHCKYKNCSTIGAVNYNSNLKLSFKVTVLLNTNFSEVLSLSSVKYPILWN